MTTTSRARAMALAIPTAIVLTMVTVSGTAVSHGDVGASAHASVAVPAAAPAVRWWVPPILAQSTDQDPVFGCWLDVKPDDVEPICVALAEPADQTVACLLKLGYHGDLAHRDHMEAIYAPEGVVGDCSATAV